MERLLATEREAMRTSTQTYEHTISGLLQKRREIMEEMAVTRERLGAMANDIEAIDRVLERLGHDTALEERAQAPQNVVFYRGQLRQWLLTQLREHGPATARQLAERLLQLQQKDLNDRRLMADVVTRVGKGLHNMHNARMVAKTQASKRGDNLWRLQG
jgi:chorismate mutase